MDAFFFNLSVQATSSFDDGSAIRTEDLFLSGF
jgi:hypothetical protein